MIYEILKNIPDEIKLGDRNSEDMPLNNLINTYNDVVNRSSYLTKATDEMTGKEFKDNLSKINYQVLLSLLDKYNKDFMVHSGVSIVDQETDDNLITQKTKQWLILSAGLMVIFTICMLIVLIVFVGTLRGDIDSTAILSKFIGMAFEGANIIFGNPDPTSP